MPVGIWRDWNGRDYHVWGLMLQVKQELAGVASERVDGRGNETQRAEMPLRANYDGALLTASD